MNDKAPIYTDGLLKNLLVSFPQVRGKMTANAQLYKGAWLQVGGPAEVLYQPYDADDLESFFKTCPRDIPITVLGSSSNTLIRDGGIPGVVIRLGPRFAFCYNEDDIIVAGSSALDLNVSRKAMDTGLSGLEFLCGIPGTVGGALRMNAGAHGSEVKNVLIDIEAVTRYGEHMTIKVEDMGLNYRKSDMPKDTCFLQARFQCKKDDPAEIEARMKTNMATRGETQPVNMHTGGSTFKNPEGHSAWKLVEDAGCRGLRVGGAVMSEMHCNFMINEGDATAKDLEELGKEVCRRVKEKSGIELQWEIKRIGVPLETE